MKIVVVYTSMGGLIGTMKNLINESFPGSEIVNIADDSLILEVIENDRVTKCVKRRMMNYFRSAVELKPDAIVSACSSVGEVAELADEIFEVPIIRIDKAMIEKAIVNNKKIGVLASIETTISPTVSYIKRLSQVHGKNVDVVGVVASGAYMANRNGQKELHDDLIIKAAKEMNDGLDLILLAQGSMAHLEKKISEEVNLPVYSSPKLCISSIKTLLKEGYNVTL